MTMATAAAVAFVVYSCRGKLSEAEKLDLSVTPLQRVDSMFFVQTENGRLKLRVEAGAMEKYETDSLDYEIFPEGFNLYGYASDGNLETIIVADEARHDKKVRGGNGEIWKAYGHVVVRNVIKQERIETDTLYWDQVAEEIYTDCYVKLFSPSGFMQGYGMRSDEMARNSIVHRPFDSYGVVVQDSTEVVIDTANFIGPLLKK